MKAVPTTRAGFITLLILLLTAAVTYGTPAEDLINRTPDGTLFFAATSGGEALNEPFAQSHIGQIWNDPQVQNFIKQILSEVTKPELADSDNPDIEELQKVLDFAKTILTRPCLVGGVADADNPARGPAVFFLLETGGDKLKYDRFIEDRIFGNDKEEIKTRWLSETRVKYIESGEEAKLYWGWQDSLLVLAINDPDWRVICNLKPADGFRKPSQLADIPQRGDILAAWCDVPALLNVMKPVLNREEPDAYEKIQAVMNQLGLASLNHLIVRMGFDGPNLISDSLVEIPAPHIGLLSSFQMVDKHMICLADPTAFDVSACAIRPAAIYDAVMNTIKTADLNMFEEAQQAIGSVEKMIGFSIRTELLENITGSSVDYMIPAYTNPEVPNGGGSLIFRLKSAQPVTKCLTALENLAKAKAPADQLQIQTQERNGNELHIFISPFLTMAQVIPCWVIEDDWLIISTHPSLAAADCVRIADMNASDSFCGNKMWRSYENRYPQNPCMMTFTDSKVQMRQMLTGLQQVWPMLCMGATQQNIKLPMMLPNLDQYLESFSPATAYTVLTVRGLESRYVGPGVDSSSQMAIGGGAMGMAILMPTLNKTRQTAQRTVSATNLKSIGMACIIHANDYDGKFPADLTELIDTADLSPKSLESPYHKTAPGPDYYYISGQTDDSPAQNILAFDNPRRCKDKINVLYADGHVAATDPDEFEKELKETYSKLILPIPQELMDYFETLGNEQSVAPGNPSDIRITVTDEGNVLYNGTEIGIDGVGPLVKSQLKNGDRPVIIQANTTTQSDLLIKIIDEAKQAGAAKVSVAHRK